MPLPLILFEQYIEAEDALMAQCNAAFAAAQTPEEELAVLRYYGDLLLFLRSLYGLQ